MELVGSLRTLLSCQSDLELLSIHTERLLEDRHNIRVPRARQTEHSRIHDEYGTFLHQPALSEWENSLAPFKDKIFPRVYPDSGSIHWLKITQEAQDIENAVRRLTRTNALTKNEIAAIRDKHHLAEAFKEEVRLSPYKSEVWTFRALQRDVEELLPLIRSIAIVCQIMGDFGDARENLSAAGIAYISEQLTQCATNLEEASAFFSFYANRHPKKRLINAQTKLLKDVALIHHSAKSLRETRTSSSRLYTPPVIAEIMMLSSDTIIRYIRKMEKRYKQRTTREIETVKERMKAEGKDPLIYTDTYERGITAIEREGYGELKPHEDGRNARRAYRWEQVEKIRACYRDQHTRWRNRTNRD